MLESKNRLKYHKFNTLKRIRPLAQVFFFLIQDDPDRTNAVLHDNFYWTGKLKIIVNVKFKSLDLEISVFSQSMHNVHHIL